ncbi:CAP domain-containing protein [Archaeoglobus profundus]|uniref:SCP-like extracellular n=1 Tax=Archaeoglobus profundus (strain DSM 5631 / JCM 9629 / NBRC 100127 / Av18) TaxID=572546 RepID=D2RI53_ARCPA|nr:CAP domain-containing protein [Archaeoglobus profundus]ADB57978.1 SCP-like extracellular [Archaeoglobus profundus DSM 5631]
MNEKEIAKWVVRYTNIERKKYKLRRLTGHKALIRASIKYSRLLSRIRKLGHHFDGDPLSRASREGFPSTYIGENCALVYAERNEHPKAVAKKIVNLWMKSPGHRSNILNCRYNKIGVGISARWSKKRRMYEVYAVQMFGYQPSLKSTIAPSILSIIVGYIRGTVSILALIAIIAIIYLIVTTIRAYSHI